MDLEWVENKWTSEEEYRTTRSSPVDSKLNGGPRRSPQGSSRWVEEELDTLLEAMVVVAAVE